MVNSAHLMHLLTHSSEFGGAEGTTFHISCNPRMDDGSGYRCSVASAQHSAMLKLSQHIFQLVYSYFITTPGFQYLSKIIGQYATLRHDECRYCARYFCWPNFDIRTPSPRRHPNSTTQRS